MKRKVWWIVLAAAAATIVLFVCFVVVADRWQQSAGDRTFASKKDFDAFVGQLKEKGALVMEEDGYYCMEVPSRPLKKAAYEGAIAYPIQNSDGYYFDYPPYRQSDCKTLLTFGVIQEQEIGLIAVECIRHRQSDLIRLNFHTHPSQNDLYFYDAKGELKGTVKNGEDIQLQMFFFVQDASECPTFSINDITYRIENKKLVRVD